MHRPRIGIPLTLDDRGRWREGRAYHYIDRRYADAVARAGGLPLQLPIQADVEALADAIDGLLIPGGDDFPSDVPLPDDVELDLVPESQLAFDVALYEAAVRRGLPVLGICYGMQLIARQHGGVLDAHLPTCRPDASSHALPSDARHPVAITPGTRLALICGSDDASVNSLHHQAVRQTGAAHRVSALSPDDVIEALELATDAGRWEIGVQWHPEKMASSTSTALFDAFVDACRVPQERNACG